MLGSGCRLVDRPEQGLADQVEGELVQAQEQGQLAGEAVGDLHLGVAESHRQSHEGVRGIGVGEEILPTRLTDERHRRGALAEEEGVGDVGHDHVPDLLPLLLQASRVEPVGAEVGVGHRGLDTRDALLGGGVEVGEEVGHRRHAGMGSQVLGLRLLGSLLAHRIVLVVLLLVLLVLVALLVLGLVDVRLPAGDHRAVVLAVVDAGRLTLDQGLGAVAVGLVGVVVAGMSAHDDDLLDVLCVGPLTARTDQSCLVIIYPMVPEVGFDTYIAPLKRVNKLWLW